MLRLGHHGAAMLAYAPVIAISSGPLRWGAICAFPLALLAARLPDADRRLPLVPHRGPTHTVWFAGFVALAVSVGLGAVWGPLEPAGQVVTGLAAGLGVVSHLLADAITPAGVRPLWPIWDRSISLRLVRASNAPANWLLFVAGLAAISLALGSHGASWALGGG